jgi:hypothetical protein
MTYRWTSRATPGNGLAHVGLNGQCSLIEDGTNTHVLTMTGGSPAWAAPTAADAWTFVRKTESQTTSGTANVNVTDLLFTPAASKRYWIIGKLLVRTATAASGVRPGIAWPSGLDDGASKIFVPNSNTASAQRWQGAKTTQFAAGTGLPTTTDSYLVEIDAYLITGGAPSGNFQITFASETADAVLVTVRAGSWIAYREIP